MKTHLLRCHCRMLLSSTTLFIFLRRNDDSNESIRFVQLESSSYATYRTCTLAWGA